MAMWNWQYTLGTLLFGIGGGLFSNEMLGDKDGKNGAVKVGCQNK